jgi:hypothetical protein
MSGAIPQFPQYVLIAWCSFKHRDKKYDVSMWTAFISLRIEPSGEILAR